MTKPLKTVLKQYPLIALSRLYKRFTVQKKYGFSDASGFALLSEYWVAGNYPHFHSWVPLLR